MSSQPDTDPQDNPPEEGLFGIPWIVRILVIGLAIAAELFGQGESEMFRAFEERR